jgi:CBS domain-containing protein
MGARPEYADIPKRIEFDQAGANFYTAAREGLGARFTWLDGEELTAQHLVLDRLLPIAEAGLRRQKVADEDIKRYLGVIDARMRTGRTGASWMLSSWNALKDKAPAGERANAIVAATIQRQQTGRPVSEWERARLDEAQSTGNNYRRVDQYMTTDLFTIHAEDPVEMAATLMSWERVRHLPVEDKDHRLVGLVTYRAVLRFLAQGGSIHETPVSEIMKTEVATVGLETQTLDAIRILRTRRIGCLPVIHEGRLVGIVTEEDFMTIATNLLEQQLGTSGDGT